MIWQSIVWVNFARRHTGCFLSDIFETLIAPPILKISSFCKVVMTNKTGQVCGKNVRRYISNSFRKFVQWRHVIKMPITPKVFGLEKCNCSYWKWQSLSFKMVCVTYIPDKNYGFYRQKCIQMFQNLSPMSEFS